MGILMKYDGLTDSSISSASKLDFKKFDECSTSAGSDVLPDMGSSIVTDTTTLPTTASPKLSAAGDEVAGIPNEVRRHDGGRFG